MFDRVGRPVFGNRGEYVGIAETGRIMGMRRISRPSRGNEYHRETQYGGRADTGVPVQIWLVISHVYDAHLCVTPGFFDAQFKKATISTYPYPTSNPSIFIYLFVLYVLFMTLRQTGEKRLPFQVYNDMSSTYQRGRRYLRKILIDLRLLVLSENSIFNTVI